MSLPTGWTLFCLFLYPSLGWLFGTFTMLRWSQLPRMVLLQRVLLTTAVALIVVAVVRWLTNPLTPFGYCIAVCSFSGSQGYALGRYWFVYVLKGSCFARSPSTVAGR